MSTDGQHGSFREPVHPSDAQRSGHSDPFTRVPHQGSAAVPAQMPMVQMAVMPRPLKDTTMAWVLLVFLGGVGAHDFYLRSFGIGAFKAVTSFICTLLTFFIIGYFGLAAIFVWNVIDAFRMSGRIREVNTGIWHANDRALRAQQPRGY